MTRKAWLAAALIGGLMLGGGELRAEDYYDYDDAGTGAEKCADGTGGECEKSTIEKCLEYKVVEVQIGTKVQFEQVCARKMTSTTIRYWT